MKQIRRFSRSWYYLASSLWLFVIAFQWYRFTGHIWYKETSLLVLLTLIATVAAEFLPVGAVLRWIIKFAAIAVIHIRVVLLFHPYPFLNSYAYSYAPAGTKLWISLGQVREHLSPYIWFSLATWALFELGIRLVDRRSRILVFLGLNVAAFAILDSYTPFYLWSEAAWTVFAGMGWLVSSHFRRMEQNHPRGWKALRRSPFRIALNIAVIFACVIWIGVSMPTVHPLLDDPYSIYKNHFKTAPGGSEKKGGDTSSDGSGSAAVSSSGYSRDDSNLGGAFQFDSSPVMNVVSTARAYWRGETRQYYTGAGWVNNVRESLNPQDVGSGSAVKNDDAGQAEKQQIVQQVTMLTRQNYPVLFGAYSISQVDIADQSEIPGAIPRLIWNGQGAEMYWGGFVNNRQGSSRYPTRYTVTSEVPVVQEDKLEQLTFDELKRDSGDERSYLQIPSNFPARVKDLAAQVTAESSTPYGKIELLRDYLNQNYAYTNTPDLSRKKSSDFVDSFLFEVQEGYCDYFSTAFVMMARTLDIPARWVKGYSPGQMSSADQLERLNPSNPQAAAAASGPQTYLVTNADAHSWAEVYLGEEYGWIPVDATPGFAIPTYADAPDQADEPVMADEPEDLTEAGPDAQQTAGSAIHPAVIGWTAGAVIVLWLGFFLWRRRDDVYFGLLKLKSGRPLNAADKVVAEAGRWQSMMRRQGYGRRSHETLREAVERWEREQPELSGKLQALLDQFEQAKYSAQSVAQDDWRRTRLLSRLLRQAIRRQRMLQKRTG